MWAVDLAGALAVARAAANLRFAGPQVRGELRWLAVAKWAARHSGAGRQGYVGAEPPYGPDSGPADSQVREQARWVRCIAWNVDLAGALAIARAAADLGFAGPQARGELRWLAMAKWAARHSGAGRQGYVGQRHRV